jgi:hypothetical protein
MTITPKEKPVLALLALQIVLAFAVLVLQPGFDHPNSLGLDFNFVIVLFGVFVVAWIVGLILACMLASRRVLYVCSYLLAPLVCFGLIVLAEVVF